MKNYKTNKAIHKPELVVGDMSYDETQEVYQAGRDEPRFCGFWDIDTINKIPQSSDCYGLTARVNDDLAGFAIAQYSPTLRKATWENLYVKPSYRREIYDGKTISRYLGEEMVNKMRSIGAKSINGMVESDNHISQNSLRKLNFHEEGDFKWMRKEIK